MFKKLWVFLESIKMHFVILSTFLVTFMVLSPTVPSKVSTEVCGVNYLILIFFSRTSSFVILSSSSTTLSEYNLLFRQLCLRLNFSSHQKHNPFSLLSSNSWFLICFMGLMKVLLVLLVRVLVQWAGFDFVMVVWRVIRFIVGFNGGGGEMWSG